MHIDAYFNPFALRICVIITIFLEDLFPVLFLRLFICICEMEVFPPKIKNYFYVQVYILNFINTINDLFFYTMLQLSLKRKLKKQFYKLFSKDENVLP